MYEDRNQQRTDAWNARIGRIVLGLTLLAQCTLWPADALGAKSTPPSLPQRYAKTIEPLLRTYCVDCHGPESAEAKLTLHQLSTDPQDADAPPHWRRVLEQLEIGAMPPEDEAQPTPTERQVLVDWLRDALTAAGKGFELKAKLLLPEYGNRVNHELLFSGEIDTPAFTPARLWRMSPHVYRGKRYPLKVAGGIEAEPVSYASKSSGIRDYASQEVMNESGFLTLRAALDDILTHQMRQKESFRAIPEAKKTPGDNTLKDVIRAEFQKATGRSIDDQEMSRYLAFMKANIQEAGNESGLKISVLAIYLSTEAVYRMELGRGAPDESGRCLLSPQELALAVAYAFGDTPPADVPILRNALAENVLNDRRDVERIVRQLITQGAPPHRRELPAAFYARIVQADDSLGYGWYPRVVRFFDEFFQYSKAAGTFKDSPGQAIGSRALVAAPLGYIAEIVNEDKHVFEELLTSPRFNEHQDVSLGRLERLYQQKLATLPKSRHAGVTKWYQDGLKHGKRLRHETFRAGILTHNSWLIAHSTNDENHPVHRGIWIRERLLAGNIPDLPLDVDAQIPTGHDKTLRERHTVTRADACWKCHRLFDPLGLPFESFDDRGWIREARYFDKKNHVYLPQPALTKEQLDKLQAKGEILVLPVDATGAITGTGESETDGPVEDARELVQRLARSQRVRQSIIRHAFRYWIGRNEMLSDSQTLVAADQAYVDSGGKFSEVLVSLLTSDSFLYRK